MWRVGTADPTRARGALVAVLAGLVVWGLGCSAPQPGVVRWADGGSAAGAVRVVVAPLNLAVRLDPDLEEAVEPVWEEIIRYFQSKRARVAVIWPADARWLWQESIAAIRSSESGAPDLGTAASVFVRELAKHADFDLLVMPSLVYREARVSGRHAHWDGVRRRIALHTRGVTGQNLYTTDWSGGITGLSLHALVFTPEGRLVFQGWGGIDLVHDAVQTQAGDHERSFLRLQERLLENPEHVREGVGLALAWDTFASPR
jgi:hypothetical protein